MQKCLAIHGKYNELLLADPLIRLNRRAENSSILNFHTFICHIAFINKQTDKQKQKHSINILLLFSALRWMIPPMVVHPEKIDFRRFV